MPKSYEARRYCQCGSQIRICGGSKRGVDAAIAEWDKTHSGEGHGSCSREVAYAARIKADRRARQIAETQHETVPTLAGSPDLV